MTKRRSPGLYRPGHSPRPPAPPAGTVPDRTSPGAARRSAPPLRVRAEVAEGAPHGPGRALERHRDLAVARRGGRRGGAHRASPVQRIIPEPAPADSRCSSSRAQKVDRVVHAVAQDTEPERDRPALAARATTPQKAAVRSGGSGCHARSRSRDAPHVALHARRCRGTARRAPSRPPPRARARAARAPPAPARRHHVAPAS